MTKVYKVLCRSNKHLVSAFIEDRIATVRYMLNRPAKPKIKGSLLAAFSTFTEARDYAKSVGFAIYIADAKISKATKVADCNTALGFYDEMLLEESWMPANRVQRSEANWPKGTVFCTEITLLKRVV